MVRRAWAPIGVVLLLCATTAFAGAPYLVPLNVGVDNHLGPDPEVAVEEVVFRSPTHWTDELVVSVRDRVETGTYLEVCVWLAGTCRDSAWGRDAVNVRPLAGTEWPPSTVVRVWVYSARVFLSGDVALATWGGVMASFSPGETFEEVVPYVAAGQTGIPDLSAAFGDAPGCGGPVLGAACSTLPAPAGRVAVTLIDHHKSQPSFRACVVDAGVELVCTFGTGTRTIEGNFPAGSVVDVRPYAFLGTRHTAISGYAIVRPSV